MDKRATALVIDKGSTIMLNAQIAQQVRLARGATTEQLARQFDTTPQTIRSIRRGDSWARPDACPPPTVRTAGRPRADHETQHICGCGCNSLVSAGRLWARGHHRRGPLAKRKAHASGRPTLTADARLARWVADTEEVEHPTLSKPCLHARNGIDPRTGYAPVEFAGKQTTKHRAVYLITHGLEWDDIAGLQIDHLCGHGHRACIEPSHLEAVPGYVNVQRGQATKLTPTEAYAIRTTFLPAKQMAERYGVSVSTINAIRRGDTWRNGADFKRRYASKTAVDHDEVEPV